MSTKSNKTVWIVSELYYPEETGTGYYLTHIAEGLARHHDIKVICNQPSYSARGVRAPSEENLNGVIIKRCSTPTLNQNNFATRLINFLTVSLSIFFHSLLRIQKQDSVLVVTNPPLLPFLVLIACRIRRAKCALLVHDVYPDAMIAARIMNENSALSNIFRYLNRVLYQKMDQIGVLGRDMEDLVKVRLGDKLNDQLKLTRCWADIDEIRPSPRAENLLLNELGLQDKFVVQYAGNIGRVQDIETLIKAISALNEMVDDVHFLIIGSGVRRQWLENEIKAKRLKNCTLLDPLPRSEQQLFLNACDVAIISLVPSMTGVGVPSRMYNVLASGKPIIAAVDQESELARVINEEGVGWLVPVEQPAKLVEAILNAKSGNDLIPEMRLRARTVAEQRFSYQQVLPSYEELVESLDYHEN